MALITGVTYPNNGDRIKAENYNTPLQKVIAETNGNLDSSNILSLTGAKILPGTLPSTAFDSSVGAGWTTGDVSPTSVSYSGNRIYSLTYAATIAGYQSVGMKRRFTRSNAAPNQSTSLNGTTQFWTKTAPNKLAFADDFVVSAYIKLSSLATGTIVSRYNGTSGWIFRVLADGRVELAGFNGGAGNFSAITSAASIPINKWIHVTAQLDMSSFTNSATTSYVMFDGVDVPSIPTRGGTNPIALVQIGDLQVGAANGATFFPGKIAQLAIYNAKVTQATIRTTIGQGLTGSEASLASAYSFNNSTADLNTATPNDLVAGAGAPTATNADSPFGKGGVSTTIEYAETVDISTDGLTETVIVAESCALPTSGTIGATAHSAHQAPFGYPTGDVRGRASRVIGSSTTASTSYAALADAADPSVSCYVGPSGKALVTIAGFGLNSTADAKTFMGFAVSGASTIPATDDKAWLSRQTTATAEQRLSYTTLLTDLVPGLNTFTARHKVATGTGTFGNREITVVPL